MSETHSSVELEGLLTHLARHGSDFRGYARASLARRVATGISRMGFKDIAELRTRLAADPAVLSALLRTLTVQVSEMFRDRRFFTVFRSTVVPQLRTFPSIRLWVAGCATGEEAYSLAIILAEEQLLERSKIYCTDISAEGLATAEAGSYRLDRFARFGEEYLTCGGRGALSDHYTSIAGRAVLSPSLRAHIVFAKHDLVADGVFGQMNVVCCRNVLIYFAPALQDRALGLFHDSLIVGGFLGLGAQETIQFTAHEREFEAFDPESRWYRRC